ncbi:GntR family transcriptional regulator [Streptomyces sp. NPDC048281]|uniref:GntR family transcriptional regulator n=1 Tax=Streptomyces sp. NPDC048281 TaxID=3154715 RepID=UPI0034313F1E
MAYEAKTPKYLALAQRLQQDIEEGMYPAGSRIPSETWLANEYGMTRPTVRWALELLKNDGWLEARHGDGTFSRGRPTVSLEGLAADLGMEQDAVAALLRKHGFLKR